MVASEGTEGRDQLGGAMTELSRMMVLFSILIAVWFTQVPAFVETQNVHLKLVHFIVCKFSSKEKSVHKY